MTVIFDTLHYPDGATRTIGRVGEDVILRVDDDVHVVTLTLDEKQVAELCADLLHRSFAGRPGADWRLRAAHLAIRDIHDQDEF